MITPQLRQATSEWVTPAAQARSQETLERILDATHQLLTKKSFREISISDIARAARTSPPSIYARFENKQALLGAIFARYATAQRILVAELLDPDHWKGVPLSVILGQTFPVLVERYRERQGLIRAFLEQSSEDHRFQAAWQEVGEFMRECVTRLVLSRPSEFRHPDPVGAVRLGMECVFATLALRILMRQIDQPEMESVVRELIGLMLRYMGIDDPSAEGTRGNTAASDQPFTSNSRHVNQAGRTR